MHFINDICIINCFKNGKSWKAFRYPSKWLSERLKAAKGIIYGLFGFYLRLFTRGF
jgi:hypothetical protein